jgi:lipid II:glycine glycyltransferase (peptidoglycan interpeptide bridge formation enzyme)
MTIEQASNQQEWDAFLALQQFRPFLQSWTMGEVYRDCEEEPIRLIAKEGDAMVGICQAMIVDAKRGRHLAIPYGPIVGICNLSARPCRTDGQSAICTEIISALKDLARSHRCSFIRLSPFWPSPNAPKLSGAVPSPLHLLAEHIWYLPLQNPDPWMCNQPFDMAKDKELGTKNSALTEEQLLSAMRSTTRNLIRRAEKEGVTIEASSNPQNDISHFLSLHDETRKRHGFTPYTNAFFKAQIAHFAPRNECTLYLAHYQGKVIASSIHMHAFGETSYHHGASSYEHRKIPASYLLQWTAIRDAIKRSDRVYNFWGIAPGELSGDGFQLSDAKHPFAGVTLFKTGFGGQLLNLVHCQDIPLSKTYYLTRGFEMLRKWKRGF